MESYRRFHDDRSSRLHYLQKMVKHWLTIKKAKATLKDFVSPWQIIYIQSLIQIPEINCYEFTDARFLHCYSIDHIHTSHRHFIMRYNNKL